ncbi:leucine-rich repeat neuronal protein 4 [Lepisosteus oculatus]|uniref:leucine-rich repeat neuronal protein 4 n=1 Tax=Lepisosteus oculatus TaxID=7918 RepID=UPI00073FB468|nr:PREDICTED: leucine-rich repeat neuronal protein 4 [Lepisosteus oculatus]
MLLILGCVLTTCIVWKTESKITNNQISNFMNTENNNLIIDLSHKNLYNLSCGILSDLKIEILNISNNNIIEIPPCLPPTLKTLDLSRNNILYLTDHSLQNLTHLHNLILHGNDIKEVFLKQVVNLELLDLSYNRLQAFPHAPQWPKLQYLSVARNAIGTVNLRDLEAMPILKHLDLSQNDFNLNFSGGSNISTGIIRELVMSDTNITIVKDDPWCTFFKNVEQLYLRNKNISDFPKDCMPKLKMIHSEESPLAMKIDYSQNDKAIELSLSCDQSILNTSVTNNIIEPTSGNDSIALRKLCLLNPTLKRYSASTNVSIPSVHQTTVVTSPTTAHYTTEHKSWTTHQSPILMNIPASTVHTERTITSSASDLKRTTIKSPPQIKPTQKMATIPIFKQDFLDYNDYSHEAEPETYLGRKECNYDRCRHLQRPCSELARIHNCLCPGLSQETVRPDPPTMAEVSRITHKSAEIQWCAPYSVVDEYQLKIKQEGKVNTIKSISPMFRKLTVYELLAGKAYNICVLAKNKAGVSNEHCTTFTTDMDNIAFVYALASVAGLLLVVVIVQAICICKLCKKLPPPAETAFLASLVSISNPAFCDFEEKQATSAPIFKT